MSILKFGRTAAAALALTMLPAQAIAAAPTGLPVASSVMQDQDRGGSGADEGHPFFSSQYLIPIVIVIVIAIAFYFLLEDEDDGDGSPVTP